MAGGLITTRAASESNLGEDVADQLLARPRPLAVAAALLVALSLIPGLPKMAFLVIAAVFGFAAYAVRTIPVAASPDTAAPPPPDMPEPVVGVDPLSIEVGYALVSLVDEKQGGTLLTRVRTIRRQIAQETGIVVPAVRVADNLQLPPRGYRILVKGVEAASGELFPERLLAINPGTNTAALEGVQTREPAFGLPATWVAIDQRDSATAAGRTVVDATTALSTHLSEIVRTFLPDLITRQQVKEMIDAVGQTAPKLVEELVPKLVSVGDIQRVLRQLLRERVPVRDLTSILEAIADTAAVTKDLDAITEAVRAALGRAICRQYQNDKGELTVINVAPGLEDRLLASVVRTEQGAVLALDPQQAQSIASRIAKALEQALAQPVLLCSPTLRPHLWRLFARVLPHLGVLSHNEVPPQTTVVAVTTLD
jgi:flagellar biosynthesis protein FlhA